MREMRSHLDVGGEHLEDGAVGDADRFEWEEQRGEEGDRVEEGGEGERDEDGIGAVGVVDPAEGGPPATWHGEGGEEGGGEAGGGAEGCGGEGGASPRVVHATWHHGVVRREGHGVVGREGGASPRVVHRPPSELE